MKKIKCGLAIVLGILMCCSLVGCGQITNFAKDDGMFVGTYSPDDYWDYGEDEDAKMSIKFDGDTYKIELSLTKFGEVSCVGVRENDNLSYSGTNDNGEMFYGIIEYEEDGVVEFEIWNDDYLIYEDDDDFLEIYFKNNK